MTVPSRGAGSRRGGRRPGWLLLTVLLVLAIAASSALVFTTRIELLRLAVILSLWAAVIGAFVSVIYRRRSDIDQARVRDLKLVYDLQLDREISARHEYELAVESKLRQELAYELRAQASDEVSALRAELAALRTNLEVLFDTDLGERPAIETDRKAAHPYRDWTEDTTIIPPVPGRVESSRIMPVRSDEAVSRTVEEPIIDVPEEPLAAPIVEVAPPAEAPPPRRRRRRDDAAAAAEAVDLGGTHRRPSETGGRRRARADRPVESVRAVSSPIPMPAPPAPAQPIPTASRHTMESPEPEAEEPSGQHTGGPSVAELMARLQAGGATGGGGRRRRAE
jgi:hypothetical protein